MNKHLKYFLSSTMITLLFLAIILNLLPEYFASSFSGGLFPFGGLIGLSVFATLVLPVILLVLLLSVTFVALQIAEPGRRSRTVAVVLGGYFLALLLLFTYSKLQMSAAVSDRMDFEKRTQLLIESAVKEKHSIYCEDIFTLWASRDNDDVTHSSEYHKNLCYFWMAHDLNDYSYCEQFINRYADMKNACWNIGAIKVKKPELCFKLIERATSGTTPDPYSIASCLMAVAKSTNNISICETIRADREMAWRSDKCFKEVNAFISSKPAYDPNSDWCSIPPCKNCPQKTESPELCDYDYFYYFTS